MVHGGIDNVEDGVDDRCTPRPLRHEAAHGPVKKGWGGYGNGERVGQTHSGAVMQVWMPDITTDARDCHKDGFIFQQPRERGEREKIGREEKAIEAVV